MSDNLTDQQRLLAQSAKEALLNGMCEGKLERMFNAPIRMIRHYISLFDQEEEDKEKEKDGRN